MNQTIEKIVKRLHPQIATSPHPLQQLFGYADVLGTLVTLPMVLLGLLLQWLRTDFTVVRELWWLLPIFWLFYFLFNRNNFRFYLGLVRGNVIYSESTITLIASFASMLIFGSAVLWFDLIYIIGAFAYWMRGVHDSFAIWSRVRNFAHNLTFMLLGGNVSLWVYEQLNGRYPFPGFEQTAIVAGFAAAIMLIVIPLFVILSFVWIVTFVNERYGENLSEFTQSYYRTGLVSIVMPAGVALFGVLAAGIFGAVGLGPFLFFLIGALCVALLAHQLSSASAKMQQRSRELAMLEQMSQAILSGPIDTAVLPTLLEEYLTNMLPGVRMRVTLLPADVLFEKTIEPLPEQTAVSALIDPANPVPVPLGDLLPPRSQNNDLQLGTVVPIVTEAQTVIGTVLAVASGDRRTLPALDDYLPTLQAIAGQIAAAVQRVETYERTLASERMTRELEIAGQIQNSFLPDTIPQLEKWELTAAIVPARQTSGDFYDFVELDGGKTAVIVADVADKGTGAALYMALSRTLIRTYAMEHPDEPALALQLANERILTDTKSDQFVTVFLAILDPHSDQLLYANAGHNPAYLFQNSDLAELKNTGIPLGMFDDMAWRQEAVPLGDDATLVMYSDGVPEAQNGAGDEFGEPRLIELVTGGNGRSLPQLQDDILDAVSRFVGDAPQFDDITLVIARVR